MIHLNRWHKYHFNEESSNEFTTTTYINSQISVSQSQTIALTFWKLGKPERDTVRTPPQDALTITGKERLYFVT